MTGNVLKLNYEWEVGEEIDRGGQAAVYEALGEIAGQFVVKLIPNTPGGKRELKIRVPENATNVIPVVDKGTCMDHFAIVMPRAEKSLHAELKASDVATSDKLFERIMLDITTAIQSLSGHVYHRDITPRNILYLDGSWCLCDFGASRNEGDDTSSNTVNNILTWPYAAPEQWELRDTSQATDIYHLGVIGYEILEGRRPFLGPKVEDYRKQHIQEIPPDMARVAPSVASLVLECLDKTPEARPSAENILKRIKRKNEGGLPGSQKLAGVNALAVSERFASTAKAAEFDQKVLERKRRADSAFQSLNRIISTLSEFIQEAAPETGINISNPFMAELRNAKLTIAAPQQTTLLSIKGKLPFDVAACSRIEFHMISSTDNGYHGRSHSLWYCDAEDKGMYRWYEFAFTDHGSTGPKHPQALNPADDAAAGPFSPGAQRWHTFICGVAIDQGEELDFIDRCLELFALAAESKLTRPEPSPANRKGWNRNMSPELRNRQT